ncbi:exocyst complex component 7-like isoform X1 [Mytilus californianus]|uniref:exocyst complex component 7-like isoform X1 n=1 Tax=Mytilus californianus TaxID=6549 RepID=UPI00224671AE|nr:exocyst complex component 7-like isoform X1 [Mytilus californianus]
MSQTKIFKADIDMKLEKEKNNLSILKEAMNKSRTNTHSMLGILNSFENRLQKLESTIEPVYNETEMLRRRQENIEKTTVTLDNVLGYYHVAKEVENMIKEGPSSCGLDRYLAQMDRLKQAMLYFDSHNSSSLELLDVTRVFEDGKEVLCCEFRLLLSRHGRPVPPIMLLDLIGDEEIPSSDPDVPLEHFPEKIVDDLGQIAKWLDKKGNTAEFTKDYLTMRGAAMLKSLQVLREHLKSASASSSTSIQYIGQHSPAPTSKFSRTKETPVRKSKLKIALPGRGLHLKKKAQTALLQSPFEQASKGHRRQGSYNDIVENLDVEVEIYITQLSALLKLMQSEAQLMSCIIPDKNRRTVFDGIVQQSLDSVVSEGEMLATQAKKSINKHEFMSVLSIFPVVKHLRSIKPDFDYTLEGCSTPTRSKLASMLSTLGSTGAKALEDFIESIKNDPDRASMPKDGTVHELTNRTIIFLEPLLDYSETAGAMLLMHGEQAAPSEAVDAKKSKLKFADYMTKVLSALGLNLSNKSETYNDPTLRPVFMLNNYNYILKSITRNGLLNLIHLCNKDVGQYYEDQIHEQKRLYSESWSKVLHYILEIDEPLSQQRLMMPDVKLKDKEKQNIKDKFSGFNKELEEIMKSQKGYAIPDQELREALKKDNKDFIIPRYKMFLEKYERVNFTKNLDKYIKYTAPAVGVIVDKFFDTSA